MKKITKWLEDLKVKLMKRKKKDKIFEAEELRSYNVPDGTSIAIKKSEKVIIDASDYVTMFKLKRDEISYLDGILRYAEKKGYTLRFENDGDKNIEVSYIEEQIKKSDLIKSLILVLVKSGYNHYLLRKLASEDYIQTNSSKDNVLQLGYSRKQFQGKLYTIEYKVVLLNLKKNPKVLVDELQ